MLVASVADVIHRRLGLALLVAFMLLAVSSTAADASEVEPNPAARWAPGTVEFNTAQQIAVSYWNANPCGGNVEVLWTVQEPNINARSFWANPYSSYDHPHLNVKCRVEFNTIMTWEWEKFCSVFVHEYGHLTGRPHSSEMSTDVMSAIYQGPIPECLPAPVAAASAPVSATVADQPANAGPATGLRADKPPRARRARSPRYSCRHYRHTARAYQACIKRVKARMNARSGRRAR